MDNPDVCDMGLSVKTRVLTFLTARNQLSYRVKVLITSRVSNRIVRTSLASDAGPLLTKIVMPLAKNV